MEREGLGRGGLGSGDLGDGRGNGGWVEWDWEWMGCCVRVMGVKGGMEKAKNGRAG